MGLFKYFEPFFKYALARNLCNINEIKSWFIYGKDEDRKEFENLIDGLNDA